MSRRWYTSPDGRMVYVGWDRPLQQFFLSIVALCPDCGGLGEELGSEIPCVACLGDGVAIDTPSTNLHSPELQGLLDELSRQSIPLPSQVQLDLEQDRATNAGDLVHDYDQT
jgi:hypothetical protein